MYTPESIYKMKNELIKELEKTIKIVDNKFNKDQLLEKFENSASEFELLVKKGLIKKRGNNILSILDRNSTNITFNTQ